MIQRLKLITSCLLLVWAVATYAAYDRTTYYRQADGKKAAALKTALYNIIGNPSVKSYNSLWTYYYDTDRLSDNQVVDRYSNTKRYFTSQNGNAVSGMNKEHGIPQSWWGGGTSGIGADLQHVMPSESDANSRKSNYGMGIVTSQSWTNGSIKVGKGTAGNNGTVQLWEPADNWKGDFARAYFYIVTAYEEKSLVQKEGANTMQNNTYPKLQQWAYELYIKWSAEDPVDDLERKRNDVVYGIQGNRNPFVDFPGLERYIWGDLKNTPVDLANYTSPDGGNTQVEATASFAVETKSMLVGETFQQGVTTDSNGAVSYESSDSDVASVDAESGLVTAHAVGSAIITATVAATSTYRSTSARYTIVVTSNGGEPQPSTGTTYEKVNTRPADWAGTYLIVYEAEDVAMNGSLSDYDVANNTIPVDIRQETIAVTTATEAAEFVATAMSDGQYSLRGKSGKYMGNTSSKNTVVASDTPLPLTLSVTSGVASIVTDNSYVLRFNSQNGQKRFRFYKSGQQSVSLYRRAAGTDTGIEVHQGNTSRNETYDLTGRRLQKITRPGVYLINGKKIWLKP